MYVISPSTASTLPILERSFARFIPFFVCWSECHPFYLTFGAYFCLLFRLSLFLSFKLFFLFWLAVFCFLFIFSLHNSPPNVPSPSVSPTAPYCAYVRTPHTRVRHDFSWSSSDHPATPATPFAFYSTKLAVLAAWSWIDLQPCEPWIRRLDTDRRWFDWIRIQRRPTPPRRQFFFHLFNLLLIRSS